LVAHHLAKVRVAGSNPVIRSEGAHRHQTPTVEWPSGEATACKAVHTGSIPVSTSDLFNPARLAQRESASLTRKRSLVQSQYRAPQYYLFRRLFLRQKQDTRTIRELMELTARSGDLRPVALSERAFTGFRTSRTARARFDSR
jgi:hypothetical protein